MPSTSRPTSSTTPANSAPGMWGMGRGLLAPTTVRRSMGFTPARSTLTSTSRGPGRGASTSLTSKFSRPGLSNTAALTPGAWRGGV